jgi:DNA-binding NtrC family response regulator
MQASDETKLKILLVDDDRAVRETVATILERLGHEVIQGTNGREGLELYASSKVDIVISDIMMPDIDGLGFLRALNEQGEDVELIFITGHGDLKTAVHALREGAFDFFTKPVRFEELAAALERTRRFQALRREKDRVQARLTSLEHDVDVRDGEPAIIGESDAIRRVAGLIDKVAATDRTTVLITGESGTGKELVARAVHRLSPRAGAPFISINSTAVPDALFESELFGHEKGAFTDARERVKGMFELSSGGSLFLDEIADMSPASQGKLLRTLEGRTIRRVGGAREIPVDVRLIAATNQDLDQLQRDGGFRQDLFFRLNVFAIHVPPLRDRGDDVLLLAFHFLRLYAAEFRKDVNSIHPAAQSLLQRYAFPGNVRELRNLMERAVILCDGDALTEAEFADLRIGHAAAAGAATGGAGAVGLANLEAEAISAAMRQSGGNLAAAARALGIGADALRYRLKKYDIQ